MNHDDGLDKIHDKLMECNVLHCKCYELILMEIYIKVAIDV